MTTFDSLLETLYEIQGASDPNDSPATLPERMTEIYEKASVALASSGYQPD